MGPVAAMNDDLNLNEKICQPPVALWDEFCIDLTGDDFEQELLSPDISCIAVARPRRWACHRATRKGVDYGS